MIDIQKMKITTVNGYTGFIYMGDTYFHIRDVANYLNLKNRYGINWSRMHELFYNALRMLRINPDDYPIPLNHDTPINGKRRISKNEKDLPEWIMGQVFIAMAQSKEDNYIYTNFIQTLQDQFKNIDNVINTENKFHRDGIYFEEDQPSMNKNDEFSIKRMFESGIDLKECQDGESTIKGFVKNGDIYLNSKDAAFMIGLYKEDENYHCIIRWELLYKYFRQYSIMFNYNSLTQGFDFRNPSNKAGFHSKYEVMIPEYIPFKIVFMMANNLTNPRACKFRFDIIFTILPYFINNAPNEEINKVEFLNSITPLIMQYRDQYYQYLNMTPQLMTYYPNTPILHNTRPAIPFWNGQPVCQPIQAYQFPSPTDIQNNLNAQKSSNNKPLKTVVYFVDNKEEESK